MATVYVGDCAFKEASDAVLGVDPFGMDQLVRTYEGRTDKLADFIKTLKKHAPDSVHKQLTLVRYQAREGRAFSQVTVEYGGLFNDELPDVVMAGGWHTATVQLESRLKTQTEIDYCGPATTFRYVVRQVPVKQKYEKKIIETDAEFEITGRRGNKTGLLIKLRPRTFTVIGNTDPTEPVNDADFGYYINVGTESFTFEQVGRYWQVTEINHGRITDEDESRLRLGRPPSAYTVILS